MLATQHIEAFLILTTMSVAYSMKLRRMERLRRAVTKNRVPDMQGVWTFGAVVALPPVWLVAAVGVIYAADWRSRIAADGSRWMHAGKLSYSAASIALAGVISSEVLRRFSLMALPAALILFTMVNIGLVAIAIIVSGKTDKLKMLADRKSHTLELGTNMIGAALGGAMIAHPSIGILAIPALLLVHRLAAREAVESTGAFDPTDETWRYDAWLFQASELVGLRGACSVFAVDICGSTEPQAARIIKGCISEHGVVCRIGDLFLAVTPARHGGTAAMMAGRIQQSLHRAGVVATLGMAHGAIIGELVAAATQQVRTSDSAPIG